MIFYDTGCSDFLVRNSAVQHLGNNAKIQCHGPINIGGVGDVATISPGVFSVKIPLADAGIAVLTGPSLPKITTTFQRYPLDEVVKDIYQHHAKSGGDVLDLPSVPSAIGGDVDFLIGIKYLRYHPEPIVKLPSGLTIYKSVFKGSDGSRGVIGGPHQVFSNIQQHGLCKTFFTNQLKIFQSGFQVNPDLTLLGYKNASKINKVYLKRETEFRMAEEVGSEVSYRCIKCRSCSDCKDHDTSRSISIREEVEQQIINKTVSVDVSKNLTMASLPFTKDPKVRLIPNRWKAMKVYEQQTKRLN